MMCTFRTGFITFWVLIILKGVRSPSGKRAKLILHAFGFMIFFCDFEFCTGFDYIFNAYILWASFCDHDLLISVILGSRGVWGVLRSKAILLARLAVAVVAPNWLTV